MSWSPPSCSACSTSPVTTGTAGHRLAVLTASTRPSTQRSWAQHDSRHPDAHTLFAWGAMARGTRTPPHDAEFDEAVGACVTAARLRPHDLNPWVVRLGLR